MTPAVQFNLPLSLYADKRAFENAGVLLKDMLDILAQTENQNIRLPAAYEAKIRTIADDLTVSFTGKDGIFKTVTLSVHRDLLTPEVVAQDRLAIFTYVTEFLETLLASPKVEYSYPEDNTSHFSLEASRLSDKFPQLKKLDRISGEVNFSTPLGTGGLHFFGNEIKPYTVSNDPWCKTGPVEIICNENPDSQKFFISAAGFAFGNVPLPDAMERLRLEEEFSDGGPQESNW